MSKPESASLPYRLLVGAVRLVLPLLVRRSWEGLHWVPKEGPVLVVGNHTSNFDPISLADALVAAGRWPRFLAKSDIWQVPVLGWLAVQCRQIPVERNTSRAKEALRYALEALDEGSCVALYPEGTITRDPAGWPMKARRGVAQLALAREVPVIPIAQHGPSALLGGRYLELRKLFSLKRRPIKLLVGEPVELSDLRHGEPGKRELEEATRRIMSRVSDLYGKLAGEPVPELIWDPWAEGYVSREQ